MNEEKPDHVHIVSPETLAAVENLTRPQERMEPPPVVAAPKPRKCAHGAFPWPCPWPSCPLGAGGKSRIKLPLRLNDGSIVIALFRREKRLIDGKLGFGWAPDK